MNSLYGFILLFGVASLAAGQTLKCSLKHADVPSQWLDMDNDCISLMKKQVNVEIGASLTYLAMAAYFARDTVNRPGFSKFFMESASEEREHAIKIIEYLLMRGQLTYGVNELLQLSTLAPNPQEWAGGMVALSKALELEAKVTQSIHTITKKCEEPKPNGFNDYHLVDYLTTDFLDEQYKGQRELAGKISTLGKMLKSHGALAEFLFDKKLLNGEL